MSLILVVREATGQTQTTVGTILVQSASAVCWDLLETRQDGPPQQRADPHSGGRGGRGRQDGLPQRSLPPTRTTYLVVVNLPCLPQPPCHALLLLLPLDHQRILQCSFDGLSSSSCWLLLQKSVQLRITPMHIYTSMRRRVPLAGTF